MRHSNTRIKGWRAKKNGYPLSSEEEEEEGKERGVQRFIKRILGKNGPPRRKVNSR